MLVSTGKLHVTKNYLTPKTCIFAGGGGSLLINKQTYLFAQSQASWELFVISYAESCVMKVCKESCVINTECTGTTNLFLEVCNSVSFSVYSHVSEQFAIFQFPLILHSIKVCALCKSCNYKEFRNKFFSS